MNICRTFEKNVENTRFVHFSPYVVLKCPSCFITVTLVFNSQSEASVRNYHNLHALQINMADACEPEPSSDCSDSISGNNSSFYAESSSSKKNLQYEKPRTSSLFMEAKIMRRWRIEYHLQNGLQDGILWKRQRWETVILEEMVNLIDNPINENASPENREVACSE